MPVKAFLEQHFSGTAHAAFRKSVGQYAEGLDAADPADASAFGLRKKWDGEHEEQYRVEGGYSRLIHFLEEEAKANGAQIHCEAPVVSISWQQGSVQAHTAGGTVYEAKKVIITIPIGVLQAEPGKQGSIIFSPAIPEYLKAFRDIGSGNAVKLLLQFRKPFWRQAAGQALEDLSFLLSTAPIDTWWTQHPEKTSLLTGWVAGPRAYQLKDLRPEELLDKGIESLSEIFSLPQAQIKKLLEDWRAVAWPADPYSKGAYSYKKVNTPAALLVLNKPVANTIYFAGEALYNGLAIGTVEAALTSGKKGAAKILQSK
jgi:monoamine oxidase